MKRGSLFLPVLGAALALLGTAPAGAQERGEREPREFETRVWQFGAADRGWLGMSLDWQSDDGPVVVGAVVPESPAARAGVARGDTLLRLNGEAVRAETIRRLNPEPGDTVRLRLRRDGREREVRVVAERRDGDVIVLRDGERVRVIHPDSLRRRMAIRLDTIGAHLDSLFVRVDSLRIGDARRRIFRTLDSMVVRDFPETIPFSIEVGSRALAGAEFTQMNEGLGRYFQTDEGLLVLRVAPGSPAARAGLEAGDVVVRADGAGVESLRDLRQAVARARESSSKLEVVRQGRRRELTLRWEGSPRWEGRPVPRGEVRVIRPRTRGRQVDQ